MKTLSIIATPIGNIGEVSSLARETLSSLTTIFCEDTRVTYKLLALLKIDAQNKKLISYNQFSEQEKLSLVIETLKKVDCGLVSDAGYPVISDPGYGLVKKVRELGGTIQVINGPCSFIHAIVGSGVDSRKLYWGGFLSKKKLKRKAELEVMKKINSLATVVYFEALNSTKFGLKCLAEVFGDREIVVARELSKKFETFYKGKISEVTKNITYKGEFVFILPRVELSKPINSEEIRQNGVEQVHQLVQKGSTIRESIKALQLKEPSTIYKMYIERYKS